MAKQKTVYANYDKTERAIAEMLTENTGTHFLDSGGAYGRAWQRNQGRDFKKEPELTLDFWDDSVSFSISTFHYLTSYLEIDELAEKLQKRLVEFAELPEYKNEGWLHVYEDFAEKVLKQELGYDIHQTFNTYNGESSVDQTLQGLCFATEESEYPEYMILQIHGGCDVRGGYTAPRIFRLTEYDSFVIADGDFYASCKCTQANTDDHGYHWYVDGDGSKDSDGLPKFWKVDAKKKKAVCTKCKHKVGFSASLQY